LFYENAVPSIDRSGTPPWASEFHSAGKADLYIRRDGIEFAVVRFDRIKDVAAATMPYQVPSGSKSSGSGLATG
jgi:hypothetical protein